MLRCSTPQIKSMDAQAQQAFHESLNNIEDMIYAINTVRNGEDQQQVAGTEVHGMDMEEAE